MIRPTHLFSLFATIALSGSLTMACIQPADETLEDNSVAAGDASGDNEERAVGTAEQAVGEAEQAGLVGQAEQDGLVGQAEQDGVGEAEQDAVGTAEQDVGTAEQPAVGTAEQDVGTAEQPAVGTAEQPAVGTAEQAFLSQWSACPSADEVVVLTRPDGTRQKCTHTCLTGGAEQLLCAPARR